MLAILSSYAKADDFNTYCSTLAERLARELGPAGQLPSTLCYLCAIDVNNTLAKWVSTANLGESGKGGYACMCMCVFVCVFEYVCMYLYACMYVCMCLFVCVCVYMRSIYAIE